MNPTQDIIDEGIRNGLLVGDMLSDLVAIINSDGSLTEFDEVLDFAREGVHYLGLANDSGFIEATENLRRRKVAHEAHPVD